MTSIPAIARYDVILTVTADGDFRRSLDVLQAATSEINNSMVVSTTSQTKLTMEHLAGLKATAQSELKRQYVAAAIRRACELVV